MAHLFVKTNEDAVYPTQPYSGCAGFDLSALGNHKISSGKILNVPTGLAVDMTRLDCVYGQIYGRSGLALNCGIGVLGGVVDQSYRGGLFRIFYN